MLSLYEILKASKTGIAPDMWTALAGMNWGGKDSGHEVKELTGIPPLSFRADGTPLLDYLISGNMTQTGTPTPQNPIQPQECGERTGNLFDANTIEVGGIDIRTGEEVVNDSRRRSGFIEVTPSTAYYISRLIDESNTSILWVLGYDSSKQVITDGSGTYHSVVVNGQLALNVSSRQFTTTATTKYIRWYVTANGSYSDIMLNAGSTALPYEPYGYFIEIEVS